MRHFVCWSAPLLSLSLVLNGCGGGSTPPAEAPQSQTPSTAGPTAAAPATAPQESAPSHTRRRTLQPVELGGASSAASASAGKVAPTGEARVGSVLDAMKPLQMVLVSNWHGISRKSKGYAELNWKWDLLSNREQPALVMTTDGGRYFKEARLTWLGEEDAFRLTATDTDGVQRVYRGTFTEPVRDVAGDDSKLQRTYKLQFTQITPADDSKLAQIVLNQQENNRYLMEIYDRRGERLQLADIVSNQREGTSFAFNDSDYGDKTCIVSQGLGTIAVSHKGKTYYVCCTGCKAAFEENPERWIAKLAQREKAK